jgi:pyrroline-5-carboxylate reductase
MKDPASPAELRARVTSKGGTTEQGIMALQKGHVSHSIGLAARAAAKRAVEIGNLLSTTGCNNLRKN